MHFEAILGNKTKGFRWNLNTCSFHDASISPIIWEELSNVSEPGCEKTMGRGRLDGNSSHPRPVHFSIYFSNCCEEESPEKTSVAGVQFHNTNFAGADAFVLDMKLDTGNSLLYALSVTRRDVSLLSAHKWITDTKTHSASLLIGDAVLDIITKKDRANVLQIIITDAHSEVGNKLGAVQEELFQNQRKVHRLGRKKFSSEALEILDPPGWSDREGNIRQPPASFHLPSPCWIWTSKWTPFVNESTDEDGWSYGKRWNGNFTNQPKCFSFVRKRRWVRWRSLVSNHPPDVNNCEKMATADRGESTQALPHPRKVLESALLKARESSDLSLDETLNTLQRLCFLEFKIFYLTNIVNSHPERISLVHRAATNLSPRARRLF